MAIDSSEVATVSGSSPSVETASPDGRPSSAARHPRAPRQPGAYRYLLELSVAEGAPAEPSLLADCVRQLVEFAYCSPLAVCEETYPVLYDLAKLLQMEEAVSLCEKHAVDRLVGSSPEPPPPAAATEQRPDRGRPAGGESVRLHVCRSCSFTCQGAARMHEHRRMHHVRSYVCGFCGVTRQKTSQLLRHLIEAEHGEKVCSLCFHECAPGESMAEHYRRHNDPRPFFCSVCFARFPSRTGLNLHMPTHSSAKPFECRTCGRAFKWRHALQSHARTHGAEKKLLCDVCGFCTRHTGQFKAHKARHAGATEPCPHEGCSFRATTGWLLKDHLVTHAADKQYQCEVCGKKFGHVRNMRRHALLHGREGVLGCQRCPYKTTRSDKLAQHVRVKHGASPGPTAAGADDPPLPVEPPAAVEAVPRRPRSGPAAKRPRKASPAVGSQPMPPPAARRPVPILPRDPELVRRPATDRPRRVRRRAPRTPAVAEPAEPVRGGERVPAAPPPG
ncbi:Zinc finger protein 358 [Amphibalanus amphitrite]|uniref:Zinc finger protein 358 n=1 Tax=Amphibalanus amphitrite TaxID=1232801 RepID=A0A6A4WF69_AMPAM|nr:Zinc finger protein 358 [Amphibalanus amphitrite]